MVYYRTFTTILALAVLLLALFAASPVITVSADCEEDLAEANAELNATKEQLSKVKEERDEYAQRLEDSTMILILVMFLLVGSYIVFYLNTRRAKIALLEYQKRTGATPDRPEPRPRRRRRG